MKEVMFSPLSVCLSVSVQDISKSCGRIRMKFCGQVGWMCCKDESIRFGGGSESGSGYENHLIFLSESSPLREKAKNEVVL